MASAMADGWIAAGVATATCAPARVADALVERCEARHDRLPRCRRGCRRIRYRGRCGQTVHDRRYSPRSGCSCQRSFCRLPDLDSAKWEQVLPGVAHVSTVPNTPVSVGGRHRLREASTLSDEQSAVVLDLLGKLGAVVELDTAYCLWAARWVVALRHLSLWQSRPWAMRRSGTVSRVPMPIAL
ncbi:MAG: hypothetical protein ACLVKA_00295 [Collinsella aerofaciens]